jgi:hypothetical protein
LDYVRNPLPGLLGGEGIKLDALAKHLSTVANNLERHAIANTWVERGRRGAWELEEFANPLGFDQWQRKIAHAYTAGAAHRYFLCQASSSNF